MLNSVLSVLEAEPGQLNDGNGQAHHRQQCTGCRRVIILSVWCFLFVSQSGFRRPPTLA